MQCSRLVVIFVMSVKFYACLVHRRVGAIDDTLGKDS